MTIFLEDGTSISNVQKLSNRGEINADTELYYELGRYRGSEWIRSGKYKKIENPVRFRDTDARLDDSAFREHHGFVIVQN